MLVFKHYNTHDMFLLSANSDMIVGITNFQPMIVCKIIKGKGLIYTLQVCIIHAMYANVVHSVNEWKNAKSNTS